MTVESALPEIIQDLFLEDNAAIESIAPLCPCNICLHSQAEEYVDTFQFELAQQFCTKALQQEPDCLRALELSGVLCLETADFEQAKNVSLKHHAVHRTFQPALFCQVVSVTFVYVWRH